VRASRPERRSISSREEAIVSRRKQDRPKLTGLFAAAARIETAREWVGEVSTFGWERL